ncbi:MAG: hypothetical protein ACM3XZ_11100 [Betaproteobacteria bacterium]
MPRHRGKKDHGAQESGSQAWRLPEQVPRETTAPDSLIERIGAEEAEINAAPLKSGLREDGGDTKD